MVAVGFCSYWRLLLLRLLVRRLLLLLFPGTSTQRWDYHLYTAMAVCWDSANCHCFATSDPRKGRFAACGPKVHVCRCGAFSVPRFDLVLDLVFFLLSEPEPILQYTN